MEQFGNDVEEAGGIKLDEAFHEVVVQLLVLLAFLEAVSAREDEVVVVGEQVCDLEYLGLILLVRQIVAVWDVPAIEVRVHNPHDLVAEVAVAMLAVIFVL